MFGADGIVNKFLVNLHVIQEPIQWITDPFWAKVTIIIAITWRFTGYNMIFYLSSLQNIDKSVYEAHASMVQMPSRSFQNYDSASEADHFVYDHNIDHWNAPVV